jgi:23S rRNA pseudouridine2457 synthase
VNASIPNFGANEINIRSMRYRYFLIYKPYGMLSQFTTDDPRKRTLGELFAFPKDVYPVGRLDEDSEGLLLLTNDPKVNALLLGEGVEKEYWVQVEGVATEAALAALRKGVDISVQKRTYHTQPAVAQALVPAPDLPARVPPIRVRLTVPDCWLAITIREGKNRQVRKMTAAVGLPTLRLVRWRIAAWTLAGMGVGEVRELSSLRLG